MVRSCRRKVRTRQTNCAVVSWYACYTGFPALGPLRRTQRRLFASSHTSLCINVWFDNISSVDGVSCKTLDQRSAHVKLCRNETPKRRSVSRSNVQWLVVACQPEAAVLPPGPSASVLTSRAAPPHCHCSRRLAARHTSTLNKVPPSLPRLAGRHDCGSDGIDVVDVGTSSLCDGRERHWQLHTDGRCTQESRAHGRAPTSPSITMSVFLARPTSRSSPFTA